MLSALINFPFFFLAQRGTMASKSKRGGKEIPRTSVEMRARESAGIGRQWTEASVIGKGTRAMHNGTTEVIDRVGSTETQVRPIGRDGDGFTRGIRSRQGYA